MIHLKTSIRALILPNNGHPYGNSLQEGLRHCGVDTLVLDAGWGFDLRRHIAEICALKPDILHLQWPESLYHVRNDDNPDDIAREIGEGLAAIRNAGIALVWTMHNLKPHIPSDPEFQEKVYAHYAAMACGVIHHSACGMERALGSYTFARDARHTVQRHGYFAPDSVSSLSQQAARAQLGLDANARIFLFCGAFRYDKNIDVLLNAIGSADLDEMLVMVGQDKKDASALYPQLTLDYPNVRWAGRLTFEELGVYVNAADALISAHGDHHLTSAGPHLSQTYLKPQVCLRTPYNEEVLGESAFYFQGGDEAVAKVRSCLSGITAERLHEISQGIASGRSAYTWDRIAQKTRSFYQELLHGN